MDTYINTVDDATIKVKKIRENVKKILHLRWNHILINQELIA